jgi:hypothetical protein
VLCHRGLPWKAGLLQLTVSRSSAVYAPKSASSRPWAARGDHAPTSIQNKAKKIEKRSDEHNERMKPRRVANKKGNDPRWVGNGGKLHHTRKSAEFSGMGKLPVRSMALGAGGA